MRRHGAGERGFALLVVLWWVLFLALLGSQLAVSGRLEARRGGNVRSAAIARALAEGALQETIFHLLDSTPGRWIADGSVHLLQMAGGVARVQIRSEAGRLGLNVVSGAVLAALLANLGEPKPQAAALADAVLDWRTATEQARPHGAKAAEYRAAGLAYGPPGSDFETFDELALVRGMTPELLTRLAPFLSAYQTGVVDLSQADPAIRLAQQDAGEPIPLSDEPDSLANGPPVLDITVSVAISGGARITRHTVARLTADAARYPFQILNEY